MLARGKRSTSKKLPQIEKKPQEIDNSRQEVPNVYLEGVTIGLGSRKVKSRIFLSISEAHSVTDELERIHFLPVIHVDKASVDEAREIVHRVQPDVVAVELDKQRYNQLMEENEELLDKETPNQMNVAEGFLNQIALLEKSLGQITGSGAGEEMKAAIEEGRKIGAKIALVDRPLGAIMNSLAEVPLDEIYRFASMVPDLEELQSEEGEFDILAFLKEEGTIPEMMEQFRSEFPSLAEVLIDERDEYVAEALEFILKDVDGEIVAVLGAGHIDGVKEKLIELLEKKAAA
ncbi:MAG: hypothetical protein GF309_14690 [Candidatus Lokiarchaeota archaeon]|nr:hypothetical protein [Candidatus Lokiarchaeota archaeon]